MASTFVIKNTHTDLQIYTQPYKRDTSERVLAVIMQLQKVKVVVVLVGSGGGVGGGETAFCCIFGLCATRKAERSRDV